MTLIETLIGVLIFSSVIGAVYTLYTTMQNTMHRGELQSELQQNGRVGLAQMVREIRMAGYDPSAVIPLVTLAPKAPIRAAMSGCFSFVADVFGAGTARQITYYLSGTTLYRKFDTWDGASAFNNINPQPLAQSVEVLTFTYYTADNMIMIPASFSSTQQCPPNPSATAQVVQQLTFDQMRQIQRVAITLKTKGSQAGVQAVFFTLKADVYLRNL